MYGERLCGEQMGIGRLLVKIVAKFLLELGRGHVSVNVDPGFSDALLLQSPRLHYLASTAFFGRQKVLWRHTYA